MKFVAVFEYIADPARVNLHRPAHREYLAGLLRLSQLVASGPFADDAGGALIIYEAPNRAAAEKLIAADPFQKEGVFLKCQLRPWTAFMANRALFGPRRQAK